ncbi:MAG: Tetratricopeptide 1 repeat-containing protein [Acidobacteria bacterium]|nr:Tetratricopeptide 1 repeat-containing protein [Acidobacteriota bacterium]
MTKQTKIIQTGSGNLAFADIHDSEFNIFIGKSYQYQDLLEQLRTQEKLLSLTPDTEEAERLAISQQIGRLNNFIEQFKWDVLSLAEQFNRTPINTERLQRAKEFFDKGDFAEARAVLETELEQMLDEQTRLLIKREEYEADTLPKLRSNGEQFFILGLLTQLDYSKPNWFSDSCRYFEQSIKSYPTKDHVFHYAVFLWKHNRVAEAEKYYRKYLEDFASELSLEERAGALNNLGLLHWDSNEYEKGLAECQEALEIFKELSIDNEDRYLAQVAGGLNNVAMFYGELDDDRKALQGYEEALKIYRRLAEKSPLYLFDVAKLLSNAGSITTAKKDHKRALAQFKEALAILNALSKTKLPDIPFYVATALHNLGRLYADMGDYKLAAEAYEDSLSIRLDLAKTNPMVYLPEASCTLSNLAFLYFKAAPDREKSVDYALETIRVLLPLYEQVPFTQTYFHTAINVLQGWNISSEEIEKLIETRSSVETRQDGN